MGAELRGALGLEVLLPTLSRSSVVLLSPLEPGELSGHPAKDLVDLVAGSLWAQVMSAKESLKGDLRMCSGTWARHTAPLSSTRVGAEPTFSSSFQQPLWISRCPCLTRYQVRNDNIQMSTRTHRYARPEQRWRGYHHGPRQCTPATPACSASTPLLLRTGLCALGGADPTSWLQV